MNLIQRLIRVLGITTTLVGLHSSVHAQVRPFCANPARQIPLTTQRLRQIALNNGIGVGQTGVQLNNTVGRVFEDFVTNTFGITPPLQRGVTIFSPRRLTITTNAYGANSPKVIGDVILDGLGPLNVFNTQGRLIVSYPRSYLIEVKAVNGAITRSTNRYQAVGYNDIANSSAAAQGGRPDSPAFFGYVTTGNTTISQGLIQEVNFAFPQRPVPRVGLWQAIVCEDNNPPNQSNPDLQRGPFLPLNAQEAYPAGFTYPPFSGQISKLRSNTVQFPREPDAPEDPGL